MVAWVHLPMQCSAGVSGVLFALLVIHSHLSTRQFTVLGSLRINPRLYPLLLLVVSQILLPSVRAATHWS
jgi:hypothetical protein